MQSQAADGREVVELEVFAPEHRVRPRFAGGSRVQHVVQTQLAVVALLRREVAGLDDPQLEHIINTAAVILQKTQSNTHNEQIKLLILKDEKLG